MREIYRYILEFSDVVKVIGAIYLIYLGRKSLVNSMNFL